MKIKLIHLLFFASTLGLVGCYNTKEAYGTIAGATIGGSIGAVPGAGVGAALWVVGGAIGGALIGEAIGRAMDDSDRAVMYRTLDHNATNQPGCWTNCRTGKRFMIVPISEFVMMNDTPYCRRFISSGYVDCQKRYVYGTACRQPDGTWLAVN
jgi:surface antigen